VPTVLFREHTYGDTPPAVLFQRFPFESRLRKPLSATALQNCAALAAMLPKPAVVSANSASC